MMASKDYYAILMVHPKAEAFLIEAAYKRLAREYHPDFGGVGNNHEKMVEINEAYEVLSDPTRRRSYDEEYARQTRSAQLNVSVAIVPTPAQPAKAAQTPKQAADPMRRDVCPSPPKPASFGIDDRYLARALEGAQAWQRREDRIPDRAKWLTRIICSGGGIVLSIALFRARWLALQKFAPFAWFVLPLFGELAIRAIEKIRDAYLLRYKFNPLYNPNPAGFRAYAKAYAKYESDTVVVYVARNAIFHAQKTCQGMTRYEPMPKWFALLQNAKPCPRCGRHLSVVAKRLPSPFGQLRLPPFAVNGRSKLTL